MNALQLTGRLARDPECGPRRSTPPLTSIRLAIQRRRGREGADRGAVFVDVVAFGALADSVGQYLEQGRQVAVSGRLELDEWQAESGERRQRHKVVADEVEFLGRRGGEADAD